MNRTSAFAWPVRVYWEDTDGAGIVYYANYLRFLERARTEWLRTLGYEQRLLAQRHGVGFVVRSVSIEFLRPARLDDLLDVGLAPVRIGAGTLELMQSIERGAESIVTARVKIACVNIASFQPARIPRELRAVLAG